MIATDLDSGVQRPSSGAFQPDEDGVSVYRESKLLGAGLTVADLVKAPQNRVVSVEVGDVRALTPLGVRDDPWPQGIEEPDHPRNGAHALIVGWSGLSRSQRRQRQVALASLPSLQFVYP